MVSYCREHNVAVQTIKAVARGLWGDKPRSRNTWYEPLDDDESIRKAVHWVMGQAGVFLITTGDIRVLPKVLAAVAGFQNVPPEAEMQALVAEQGMQPLFDQ